ncbi:MAG: hypothetical protein PVH42_19380 [Desulfobacterales bacterium]|jgi:hypothetical protein
MSSKNKKGFHLINQLQLKLIIPIHIHDPACKKISADKWIDSESYKKYLSLSTDKLPE